ncbi:hypothetical protein VNO78_34801 [Psophocarpus tetragonolobus]|uniref:Uncharacterized protein n=1 Tax=Psophocarpus tetragonolobus TaxID=3891 RepID=A0AAN9NNE0_PSOTE
MGFRFSTLDTGGQWPTPHGFRPHHTTFLIEESNRNLQPSLYEHFIPLRNSPFLRKSFRGHSRQYEE